MQESKDQRFISKRLEIVIDCIFSFMKRRNSPCKIIDHLTTKDITSKTELMPECSCTQWDGTRYLSAGVHVYETQDVVIKSRNVAQLIDVQATRWIRIAYKLQILLIINHFLAKRRIRSFDWLSLTRLRALLGRQVSVTPAAPVNLKTKQHLLQASDMNGKGQYNMDQMVPITCITGIWNSEILLQMTLSLSSLSTSLSSLGLASSPSSTFGPSTVVFVSTKARPMAKFISPYWTTWYTAWQDFVALKSTQLLPKFWFVLDGKFHPYVYVTDNILTGLVMISIFQTSLRCARFFRVCLSKG